MKTKIIEVSGHKFDIVMPSVDEGFFIQGGLMSIAALTWQGKNTGPEQTSILRKMLVGAEVDGFPLNYDDFFFGNLELANMVFFSIVKELYPSFLGKMSAMFQLKMAEKSGSAES